MLCRPLYTLSFLYIVHLCKPHSALHHMFLLPGADGDWSCNERGNERMMNGNCRFIIAERLARNNITCSLLCPHGTFRASLSLCGDVSVLLHQTCCNENKQPGLGSCVLITRHFMLHFDLIRIKWLLFFWSTKTNGLERGLSQHMSSPQW